MRITLVILAPIALVAGAAQDPAFNGLDFAGWALIVCYFLRPAPRRRRRRRTS